MEKITNVLEKINIIEQEKEKNENYFLNYIIKFCTENGFTSPQNALIFDDDFQTWFESQSFSDDICDTAIESIYVENGVLKGDIFAYYLGEEKKDIDFRYEELFDLGNLMDLIKNIYETIRYKIKVNDVCKIKLHDNLFLLYGNEIYPCVVNSTKTYDNIHNIPLIDCDKLGIKELELGIADDVLSIWDKDDYGLLKVFVSLKDCEEYINEIK